MTEHDQEEGPHPTLRARSEALTARGQALWVRIGQERPRHASVEVAFRWLLRDREIAGGVLGGGLAYRLFFWSLALTLLICGGLGFASSSDVNVGADARQGGLSAAVAHSVSSAAQQSSSDRWWLIAVGSFSYVWFSWGLFRAVRLVHSAAWHVQPPPIRNAPRALLVVLLLPVAALLLSAVAGWIRGHTVGPVGLLATLTIALGFGLIWVVISSNLPAAAEAPMSAFLPGAVVFGLGIEALHLFTVYYLADKLASSSALYGALGLAGTALFFLFLIGRGVVWAAELNAVVWSLRSERADRQSAGQGGDPPAERLVADRLR